MSDNIRTELGFLEIWLLIARILRERTNVDYADTYEKFIVRKVFPTIAARHVKGLRKIELLRRLTESGKVEFMTIMWFESWRAVKEFADEDDKHACLRGITKKLRVRSDKQSQHYEVRGHLEYSL